jgi:hypothetical protein
MLKHKEIAEIAHEQNRIYCESLDDFSQPSWKGAEDWQRQSAINGVDAIASGEIRTPQQSHENWLKEKEDDGWQWGNIKDPERKMHPCFMPFTELPKEQQFKDILFFHTVRTLIKVSAAHA